MMLSGIAVLQKMMDRTMLREGVSSDTSVTAVPSEERGERGVKGVLTHAPGAI
jgi:hypothetical protein